MIGLALAFLAIIAVGMTTAWIHDKLEGWWGE